METQVPVFLKNRQIEHRKMLEGKKVPLLKWKKLIWSSFFIHAIIYNSQYDRPNTRAHVRE